MNVTEKIINILNQDEWPRIITMIENVQDTNDSIDINIAIPNSVKWFQGHFPQQPVLPGVVQTHWATSLAKACFSIEEKFQKISNLKFKNMILPEAELILSLALNKSNANTVKFHYHDQENSFSSGLIYFAES